MPEIVFNPDAHPEVSSVDGYVYHSKPDSTGLSWAEIISASGNWANDTSTSTMVRIQANVANNKWTLLTRIILLFDTSALTSNYEIISAILGVFCDIKTDVLGVKPDINVYSSNPDSNIALVMGDYDSLGSTPLCDTSIAYDDIVEDAYNYFTLNTAGLAAIVKGGITKLGLRNANYDVAGVPPTWSSGLHNCNIEINTAEQGEYYPDRIPKLIITYTPTTNRLNTIKDIPTLEAIRNVQMSAMSRFYVSEEGKATYESRYKRSL